MGLAAPKRKPAGESLSVGCSRRVEASTQKPACMFGSLLDLFPCKFEVGKLVQVQRGGGFRVIVPTFCM